MGTVAVCIPLFIKKSQRSQSLEKSRKTVCDSCVRQACTIAFYSRAEASVAKEFFTQSI